MEYRKLSGTDREKIKWVAKYLGDEYIDKPKSLIVIPWKRRFTFNETNEIIKVQDVQWLPNGKAVYADPIN